MKENKRYYSQKLSSERLRECYEVAPPRVRQYLKAEIDFVLHYTKPADSVLELGCGYGRALSPFIDRVEKIVGIDSSVESLALAGNIITGPQSCHLAAMDAGQLAFGADSFDVVACIQNGISAFKVERSRLVEEAVRVTRAGGTVLFSSYAERFWKDRLEWFRIQADRGLIGEIDYGASGSGVIVCKDGFRAETVGPDEFLALARGAGVCSRIVEVDGSSLFCVIFV